MSLQNGSGKLIPSHQASPIYTLDTIIKESNFSPNFIKIDTDGFDFKVIRGAATTIKTFAPIIYFEWSYPHLLEQAESPLAIFPFLQSYGYEKLIIFDNFGTLLCVLSSGDKENLTLLMDYTRNSVQIHYYDVLAIPAQNAFSLQEYLQIYTKQNAHARSGFKIA